MYSEPSNLGDAPGEFMDAGADLVAIQSIWAAGSGADSAVGRVNGDHSGAASFYVNIVGGIGKRCRSYWQHCDHARFI